MEHKIIVGPVIGLVTTNSARVLLETNFTTNENTKLLCRLSKSAIPRFQTSTTAAQTVQAVSSSSAAPLSSRAEEKKPLIVEDVATTSTAPIFLAQESVPLQSALKEFTVPIRQVFIPQAFTIANLEPGTRYSIEFVVQKSITSLAAAPTSAEAAPSIITFPEYRKGSFRTMDINPEYIKIGCVSCNYLENRSKKQPWDLWQVFADQVYSYDLLLHMGDQVYADGKYHKAFYTAAAFYKKKQKKWMKKNRRVDGYALPHVPYNILTAEEEDYLLNLFRDLYRNNWGYIPTIRVLANVSNLMMWDDHDVRDDWGTRKEDLDPATPEYFIGNRIARRVFWEYQMQLKEDIHPRLQRIIHSSQPHYSSFLDDYAYEGFYHKIGQNAPTSTGILMLDQRGMKGKDPLNPMLGTNQWDAVHKWMNSEQHLAGVNNLVVICTVPLCYFSYETTNTLGKIPSDQLNDLQDHWIWQPQHHEQIRLLELLLSWKAKDPSRQLILLGGDVHIGGFTSVYYNDTRIAHQLISSAITNNPYNILLKYMVGKFMLHPVKHKKHLQQQKKAKFIEIGNGFGCQHEEWFNSRNFGTIEIIGNASNSIAGSCSDLLSTLKQPQPIVSDALAEKYPELYCYTKMVVSQSEIDALPHTIHPLLTANRPVVGSTPSKAIFLSLTCQQAHAQF